MYVASGIEHVAAAPSRLGKQQRQAFLNEARQWFQMQMSKCTASNSWGFSAETVGRFTDAMKEAREQAPKAERWKLAKDQSHIEMARGALVMYEVMASLLPKYGKHPTRVGKSCQEVQAKLRPNLAGLSSTVVQTVC